jgi:ferredoxin
MAHVVTGRCVDCRYTDCCTVCPVDCFWEVTDPPMLVIDPETCIDCELCVPECPINAIYPESELPEVYGDWTQKNAEIFSQGVNITEKKDPLPGALTLEAIQENEKAAGWTVDEPSKAS